MEGHLCALKKMTFSIIFIKSFKVGLDEAYFGAVGLLTGLKVPRT